MNAFAKGVFFYAVQVAVATIVGTAVGSLVGIGLRWLTEGTVSHDEVMATINGSISATAFGIIILTVIGAFPVGKSKT